MAMGCVRCGGLLVRERLFEANGMSSTEQIECVRCVNCGALEDTMIRANRHPARPLMRGREPRGPRVHRDNPAALSCYVTESNHPWASHDLHIVQPYQPSGQGDKGPGGQTHGWRVGCDDDQSGSLSSSGGPE